MTSAPSIPDRILNIAGRCRYAVEAWRRLNLVLFFDEARRVGLDRRRFSLLSGASYSTAWRWARAYEAGGLNGLVPRWNRAGRRRKDNAQ
ncbi:MAG TPA: hypothetical protein PKM43_06915 [Verrucomicrobiota bacterium]|nr:hypothetical protein [Verrucomicrobiota bacterium]HRZ37769.1 hypothetical protein [Candidatus Paceibacterota bacterium]